jgi:hypothetical protein
VTFAAAGDYTYQVAGTNAAGPGALSAPKTITVSAQQTTPPAEPAPVGACPSGYVVPTGTTIVDIGTTDFYAGKDFDGVFDNAGSTFDSAVTSNQTKALKFTNGKSLSGFISGTAGNFGAGYKDFSLSVCPGDFAATLPLACLKVKKTSVNMNYSTDGSLGCTIPVNTPVYLNVRGNAGIPAGFVLQNVQQSALP